MKKPRKNQLYIKITKCPQSTDMYTISMKGIEVGPRTHAGLMHDIGNAILELARANGEDI